MVGAVRVFLSFVGSLNDFLAEVVGFAVLCFDCFFVLWVGMSAERAGRKLHERVPIEGKEDFQTDNCVANSDLCYWATGLCLRRWFRGACFPALVGFSICGLGVLVSLTHFLALLWLGGFGEIGRKRALTLSRRLTYAGVLFGWVWAWNAMLGEKRYHDGSQFFPVLRMCDDQSFLLLQIGDSHVEGE